jgi:hypothetical protein
MLPWSGRLCHSAGRRSSAERWKVESPIRSLPSHVQPENLTRLTFDKHFKRTAADLAIGRESLGWGARIDGQLKGLAAIRAPDGFSDFHAQQKV